MAARTKKDADDAPEPQRARPKSSATGAGAGEKLAPKPKPAAPLPRKGSPATPRPDAERIGALTALAAGLEEIVPGIEIVDRDLVFDEGGRADLAGIDPAGKLYLVLLAPLSADAEGSGDRIVLDALDTLAFAEKNLALLTRHLGQKRPIRSTGVLVICLEPDERLRVRFRPLLARGVGLFRIRTLKSAAGEHNYLVPWDEDAVGAAAPAGIDGFLEGLSSARVALVRSLIGRLSRLDATLQPEAHNGSLVWHAEGVELVRLDSRGDGLETLLVEEGRPRRLASEDDLENLTEGALQRLVALWGAEGNESADLKEPSAEPIPREGPILTTEEINAFLE